MDNIHNMDHWESQSENESTVSSRSRYSESSQHHYAAPISFTAAKFIRKRRARMLGISASSSSSSSPPKPSFVIQRPIRLRRATFQNKSESGVAGLSTSSGSASERPGTSGGMKTRKAKLNKLKPPPLTPMQLEIRRLYDSICRSHRKTHRESINQAWSDNWKNVSAQTKQHDRFQRVKAASTLFMSMGAGIVTTDDIIKASSDAVANRISTVDKVKVSVMSDGVVGIKTEMLSTEKLSPAGNKQQSSSTKQDQRVPAVTIGNVTQIPPVLDWTAIPHNMHEDDGKFLTNIPFLGDEFIDKDSNFLDEMMTLYEGKVHEDKDSSIKMRDDVLYNLVQTMVKIEADAPGVFNEAKEELVEPSPVKTVDFTEEMKMEYECEKKEFPAKKTTFSDVAAKLFTPGDSPPKSWSFSTGSEMSESVSDVPTMEELSGEGASCCVSAASVLSSENDKRVKDSAEKVGESVQTLSSPDQFKVKRFSTTEESNLNFTDFAASASGAGESSRPSEGIFSILSATFKGIGNPNEIREKYEMAERSRNAPPLPILPNGMEQQNPESYSIPNIEGPFAKYLPKEATMHAYQFLFCRRCFTYDCKRHTGDDQVDAKHYKRNRQMTPATSSSSASASTANAFNFTCEHQNCWQRNEFPRRKAEEILTEWTPSDRSLFLCFIDSFPSNYCFISFLIRNKSCVQVKEYADLENVPVEETCPRPIAPRAKTKHRKKICANSHNRKNAVTRRWINKVKKTKESKEGGMKCPGGFLPVRYMPCLHENGEECGASCTCRINKTSCEKFCTCALTCPYRFPGCKCLSTCDSKRCICFAAARECDPDLCLGCGANEEDLEKISCHNVNIQRKLHKHLLMGRSDISGWGIYIKDDAQKGEFIAEYRGELISYDESERRGHVYDKIQHTFLFELNDHFVVDATRKGNKARFVNSSKNPNCEVKRMLVNGDHRIGIYAKRYIEAGEELFYDYEDVLEKQQKAAGGANRKRKD